MHDDGVDGSEEGNQTLSYAHLRRLHQSSQN